MTSKLLAFFGLPGGVEWVIILVVALLLFGRRLPDVARSFGKSIVEFKKGIRDVKSDIDVQSQLESSTPSKLEKQSNPADQQTSAPATQTNTAQADESSSDS